MEQQKPEMKNEEKIIRIMSKDINGGMNIYVGLTKIKGISWSFSNAICKSLKIDKNKKIGDLNKEDIKEILMAARETRKDFNEHHKSESEHEEERCRMIRKQKVEAHPDRLCVYQKEQDVGQVWQLEKYDPDLDCERCDEERQKEGKGGFITTGAYWMANEKYKIGICPKHFKEFIDEEHFYSKVIALPAGHNVDDCECTVYPGDKGYLA